MENAINDAIVVEKKEGGAIQLDSKIKILFAGTEENYQIVPPSQADVLNNKISYQSPLGKELMGKKVGDVFDYELKGKKVKVEVLEIE
jgi:transcription elongation factor GreA